jgi:hypothetical protein
MRKYEIGFAKVLTGRTGVDSAFEVFYRVDRLKNLREHCLRLASRDAVIFPGWHLLWYAWRDTEDKMHVHPRSLLAAPNTQNF